MAKIGDLQPFEPVSNYYNNCNTSSTLIKEQYVDIKSYLVDLNLVIMDRVSMANSLEVRVPFLDHNFVEFCFSILPNLKLNRFNKKFIFKRAMLKYLPKEIVNRKKQDLSSPIKNLFRNEFKDYLIETLLDSNIVREDLIKFDYLNKLINQHVRGYNDHSRRLWSFLTLELWYKKFMV